jgi:NAD(P)H dehydrogenase (quinone)
MNILIVYAHPAPDSFDCRMKDKAIEVLVGDGHQVQLSDLYAMGFKAESDAGDFTDPIEPAVCNFQSEQIHAAKNHTFSPDILQEQQKILWSECIIFQFPMWWYSAPAILKGWFDRVLTYGFAYGQGHSLVGRRAILVVTTGGAPRPFTPEKRLVINNMLDHIQRSILYFCGLDILPPYAIYGAANAASEQHDQYLLQYTQLLRALDQIPPIDYHRSGW